MKFFETAKNAGITYLASGAIGLYGGLITAMSADHALLEAKIKLIS